jgi:hypothetical protein
MAIGKVCVEANGCEVDVRRQAMAKRCVNLYVRVRVRPAGVARASLLVDPLERLGKWLLTPITQGHDLSAPAASPLREPVAEWRDLLYSNVAIFLACLFLLLVAGLAFLGVGVIGTRIRGVLPSGRAFLPPFVTLLMTLAVAAGIYTFRLAITINYGTLVLKDSRALRESGDTREQADLLRKRYRRAYALLRPRSWDGLIAIAAGVVAGIIAWSSS